MSTVGLTTKEKLLSLLDDEEKIVKNLLDELSSTKPQKMNIHTVLISMKTLMKKGGKVNVLFNLAREQKQIEELTVKLQKEVEAKDQYIRRFEQQLKEAEELLASANYQAKQKLASIDKANKRPVSSEELIRYAHKISSVESVSAPSNWQPGDPRRPYPTEIDMRLGMLSRYTNNPLEAHLLPPQASLQDIHHRSNHPPGTEPPTQISSQFTWHPSGDIHMNAPNQTPVQIETRSHSKDTEDVEVMSTDSSSSSSSDSQ